MIAGAGLALTGAALVLQVAIRSTPDLGTAGARCHDKEIGPALQVAIEGLKDRQGVLKLEVYPANDEDFLADDNILVGAGKTFRRVVEPVPAGGPVRLCVRVPAPGNYAVTVLHDRNNNRKFDLSKDGVGFTRNPKLGLAKPKAREVSIHIGTGVGQADVILNYRKGLFSFSPIEGR